MILPADQLIAAFDGKCATELLIAHQSDRAKRSGGSLRPPRKNRIKDSEMLQPIDPSQAFMA
jgi:hypothetical protein